MQFAGIDFVCVYATLLIQKLDDKAAASDRISPGILSMTMGLV